MIKNNVASVFVYVLILVTLTASMAMIVVSNISVLQNTLDEEELDLNLESSFREQFFSTIDRTVYFNTDGWWLNDSFWCPNNIIMSGSTVRTTGITTTYAKQWDEIFCRGSFNGQNLDILFNSDYTTFDFARYADSQTIQLSWDYSKIWDYPFSDSDNSRIEFNSTYYASDGIDDNFNSDNFTIENTSSNSYPAWIIDNDADARIFGETFLAPDNTWNNTFWNTDTIEKYIAENPHNADAGINLLWTSTGYLFVEVEENIDLRITEFKKDDFDNFYELVPIDKKEYQYTATSSGYLQTDGTISWNLTWNEFEFDFQNKYYAIFWKNTHTTDWKKFRFHFETQTWENIVIFPIKEPIWSSDHTGNYSYLAYKILVNSKGRYIYKIQEIFHYKE